jgi:hypothetical protein
MQSFVTDVYYGMFAIMLYIIIKGILDGRK